MDWFTLKAVHVMFIKNAFIIFAGIFLFGQTALIRAEKQPENWQAEVVKLDTAYWAAFNRADPKGLNSFLADDVEFYHDRGGTLIGKAALSEVNNGMSTSKNRMRREAIAGTVRFFPMRQGDTIYGAIVSGEHQFHITEKGKPESLAGRAIFSHLLLLKGGVWKVSRIYSYEHGDATPTKNSK